MLQLGLEADHVPQGAERIVLAQLDDGIGPAAGARIEDVTQFTAMVFLVQEGGRRHPAPGDLRRGAANLARHIEIVRGFGFDPVVAVNLFPENSSDDVELVRAERQVVTLDE